MDLPEPSGMVGCLVVPNLPVACELAERPELRGRPVAVARSDQPTVWAASPSAAGAGVVVDQPIRQAIALCPGLQVLDPRPARYAEQSEAILDTLERAAPVVEPDSDGVAYLDLRGLDHCYPSSAAMCSALLAAAPGALEPRLGIAPDKFTASVAAHSAASLQTVVVRPDHVRGFLAGRPVDTLPVSSETHGWLRMLGIETLGSLAGFSKAALIAEFGREGGRAWLLARGEDPDPVRPRALIERVSEPMLLDAPLVNRDALLVALEQLVSRICGRAEFHGRAAHQAMLVMGSERGERWERTITFKEPLGGGRELWRLLCSRLGDIQPPGPVIELVLTLTDLTSARGWQGTLPVGDGGRRDQLDESLRTLRTRYGHCPVGKVIEVAPGNRFTDKRWALIDCVH